MQTLDELGLKYQTDKASDGHNYLQFYERYLKPLRAEAIMLVEAGIGGYEYPDRGGQSLRMWREYFYNPYATIIGFDIFDKSLIEEIPNTTIMKMSQDDAAQLNAAFVDGHIDIFIDDASHINELSIKTFEIMFPKLKPGGIYIWEDIHTSYWPGEYGGRFDPDLSNYINVEGDISTAASFLQRLQHGLQVDSIQEIYRGPWDGHIQEMHFMRNTCVIVKRK